jgi:hypothetical protein
MATFGYTTVGETDTNGSNANGQIAIGGINFTPASSGTVDSISMYLSGSPSKIKYALYAGNNLVSESVTASETQPASIDWLTINSGGSVSNAVAYDIAFMFIGIAHYRYDSGATFKRKIGSTADQYNPDTGTFDNPITWSNGFYSAKFSIYATYTESQSGYSSPFPSFRII